MASSWPSACPMDPSPSTTSRTASCCPLRRCTAARSGCWHGCPPPPPTPPAAAATRPTRAPSRTCSRRCLCFLRAPVRSSSSSMLGRCSWTCRCTGCCSRASAPSASTSPSRRTSRRASTWRYTAASRSASSRWPTSLHSTLGERRRRWCQPAWRRHCMRSHLWFKPRPPPAPPFLTARASSTLLARWCSASGPGSSPELAPRSRRSPSPSLSAARSPSVRERRWGWRAELGMRPRQGSAQRWTSSAPWCGS
mmetsp:Transcript_27772/g.89755  ORF Transcript_27772/g.89755 Transcript_27772/m.89755 type:complete len:252 (-) Transcript_27772:165-920(-)